MGLFHPLLVQLLEAADLRLSERAREFEAALSAERADARDRASDAALASDTRCPACSGVTAAAWHRSMFFMLHLVRAVVSPCSACIRAAEFVAESKQAEFRDDTR